VTRAATSLPPVLPVTALVFGGVAIGKAFEWIRAHGQDWLSLFHVHPEPLLDAHLPEPTERAVLIAHSTEKNPATLRAFANALVQDFPSAASLLAARAREREIRRMPPVTVSSGGVDLNPVHLAKDAAHTLTAPVRLVGKIPIIRDAGREAKKLMGSKVMKLVTTGFVQLHPAVWVTMLVAGAGKDALKGERLDRVLNDTRLKTGGWLKTEGALAANVPGIGPVLGPALTAAGALALGEPIPEAMIDVAAAAVPGGPIAQAAVKTGGTFAVDLAKGEKLDQAGLGAARAAAVSAGQAAGIPNGIVGTAFDAGLGLAQGKKLQEVGFKAAASMVKSQGGSIAESVANAIDLGASGSQLASLIDHARTALKADLPPHAADLARPVAREIVQHPALARLPAALLARRLNVHPAVARAVLAASHEPPAAPGTVVVDPAKLSSLVGRPSPPTGRIDAGHLTIALRAAKGDASAAKQISHAKAQSPAAAPVLAQASRMAIRALWTRKYAGPDAASSTATPPSSEESSDSDDTDNTNDTEDA
jgi:hypothetical protein